MVLDGFKSLWVWCATSAFEILTCLIEIEMLRELGESDAIKPVNFDRRCYSFFFFLEHLQKEIKLTLQSSGRLCVSMEASVAFAVKLQRQTKAIS